VLLVPFAAVAAADLEESRVLEELLVLEVEAAEVDSHSVAGSAAAVPKVSAV
jgi:hypothetical protein